MAQKKKSKNAIKNDVIKKMKSLGTYKPEYSSMIEIFAGMLYHYSEFEEKFEDSNYKITEEYTNKAGATNERKTPIYMAMESLRKDIATYSDRLCLNPKSIESVTTDNSRKSKLSTLLSEIS